QSSSRHSGLPLLSDLVDGEHGAESGQKLHEKGEETVEVATLLAALIVVEGDDEDVEHGRRTLHRHEFEQRQIDVGRRAGDPESSNDEAVVEGVDVRRPFGQVDERGEHEMGEERGEQDRRMVQRLGQLVEWIRGVWSWRLHGEGQKRKRVFASM
ncbi:hypothetical protein PENTCL1PPCAC_28495, partial [Pristionchus entomophagus]